VIPLTPRQREVVERVRDGETYAEIAARLGISARTVRMHARDAAKKIPGKGPPLIRILRYAVRGT
jgi:DNA-binding CsgD family transcriptional regulator